MNFEIKENGFNTGALVIAPFKDGSIAKIWNRGSDICSNKILISVTGRTNRKQNRVFRFQTSIIFKICDFLVHKEYRNDNPPLLSIDFGTDESKFVVITEPKVMRYRFYPEQLERLFQAILLADKEYAKLRTGIFYPRPFSADTERVEIIRSALGLAPK